MKKLIYALTLSALIFSCKQEKSAIYTPKTITANQRFNEYNKTSDSTFNVSKAEAKGESGSEENTRELFSIKFKDTLVKIQTNESDPASATDKFISADYINTQKTALLVQIADNSGLTAPAYILALKDDQLEVLSLYRASNGKEDKKYTKGIVRVGRQGYLVNNDFFVTNVNAKVYLIKRQHPDERIQGDFFINSSDKTTLVFKMPASFYQVNYPTNEVYTQPFSAPKDPNVDIYQHVQANFIWTKDKKGAVFLKPGNDNRIIDIKEFN